MRQQMEFTALARRFRLMSGGRRRMLLGRPWRLACLSLSLSLLLSELLMYELLVYVNLNLRTQKRSNGYCSCSPFPIDKRGIGNMAKQTWKEWVTLKQNSCQRAPSRIRSSSRNKLNSAQTIHRSSGTEECHRMDTERARVAESRGATGGTYAERV